jgi:hypothetical protein
MDMTVITQQINDLVLVVSTSTLAVISVVFAFKAYQWIRAAISEGDDHKTAYEEMMRDTYGK